MRSLIFATAALLLTATGCRNRAVEADKQARREVLVALDTVLRDGDIVFRRGNGLVSHAVIAADRGGIYSHVGIAYFMGARAVDSEGLSGEWVGHWLVVHIVPGEPEADGTEDRIKAEPLAEFFSLDRARSGAVMRVEDAMTEKVVAEAMRLLETGLLFDHEYDLADTTKMYCTELIYNVFRNAAGVDITAGRRSRVNLPGFGGDYILPSDIQQSEKVTTKYQF